MPASKTAIVKQIVVTNVTGSSATFSLFIGSAATPNALFSATSVAANDAIVINLSQVLNSTEILTALASANSTLNITISGVENDGPLNPLSTYIADNAITTAKLADSSVTTAKIATGAVVTADLANNAVTQAKLSTDIPLSGMRNLIINGDMRINQRNTAITGTDYTVDRWRAYRFSTTATWSVASSTDAPAGFSSSLRATVTSGASLGEYDEVAFEHRIEGNNFAFLDYGKSSAVTSCLSFWVRSSVTGTYAVELTNNNATRNYITSYVVNTANTWEKKTLVIPGDTTGTWETGTNTGLLLRLYLAVGTSARTNTVNQWSADSFGNLIWAPSGTLANPLSTTNNIFAITGVQLEAGSQATPFEQRPYGTELALCQRYFQSYIDPPLRGVAANDTRPTRMALMLPVPMRVSPTSYAFSGTLNFWDGSSSGAYSSTFATFFRNTHVEFDFNLTVGYTAGKAICLYIGGGGTLTLSAEL